MQFKSSLTEDQICNDEPLLLTEHPLSKLRLMSKLITREAVASGNKPFDFYRAGDVCVVGDIINDAIKEIEYLVNIAQGRINALESRVRKLEEKSCM